MSQKMDMAELLKQFLAAQSNGQTVTMPVPAAAPAPTPVATPEITAVPAVLTPVAAPAIPPEIVAALTSQATTATVNGADKARKKGWQSCDVEMADGEKLHLRVAPKGYGCVGFESRNDYSCIFGYLGRHQKLADLFGEGYRTVVLPKLIEMGLREMPSNDE